jgi:hypothetical protein
VLAALAGLMLSLALVLTSLMLAATLMLALPLVLTAALVLAAALLTLAARRARIFDRLGGLLGFVGEAALAGGDVLQFFGVLFETLDAAALVDDLLAFVEEVFEVHLDSFRSLSRAPTLNAG